MKNKVIDLHGDLFSHFTIAGEKNENNIFKKHHFDKFKKGNVYLSMFNVWVDDESKPTKERIIEILAYGAKEVLQNKDVLNPVLKYSDIIENDKINFIIGLEGLDYVDNPVELYALYQYGARLASLTWNNSNKLAASITDTNDFGLTDKGRQAIKIMNELGMIIDISHLSDKAALEVLDISSAPVIASHSNVRNIMPHKRNVTDELIRKIAKSNGIIGMNAYPIFVSEDENQKNINGLIKHINYIKDLVGIDYIAFGFDFMDYLDDDSLDSFIEGTPYMRDLKNHQDIPRLINELRNNDYTDEEIAKITHLNALRVIKEILKE